LYGSISVVKRKDEQVHGEYRIKRVILDLYDAMQQAMETGTPLSHAPRPTAHTRLDATRNHDSNSDRTAGR